MYLEDVFNSMFSKKTSTICQFSGKPTKSRSIHQIKKMPPPPMYHAKPLREPQLHDKIFGTIARPISALSSRNEEMGLFSDNTRIQWTHFGKKYRLSFTKDELEFMDLYDVMLKKIHDLRPEFDGIIAYNDHNNRQITILNDVELRAAINLMRSKLKLYTTLPERGTLAAADMAASRAPRSHSVPPSAAARYSPVNDPRAPSSLGADYNYRTYDRHQARQHTASFDAPPQRYERSNSVNRGNSPADSNNSSRSLGGRQVQGYRGTSQYPPGYSYGYSSYSNAASATTPYTQPLLYGMPPSNMLLNHFLTGGHYPPFHHGHAYSARSGATFMGPNKILANSWGYGAPVW
uniref:PB1 domain-containing protein n=1 Tax=Panagrellus redivivus TaxID=6233 RepID=A0A7E4VD80_PANRE